MRLFYYGIFSDRFLMGKFGMDNFRPFPAGLDIPGATWEICPGDPNLLHVEFGKGLLVDVQYDTGLMAYAFHEVSEEGDEYMGDKAMVAATRVILYALVAAKHVSEQPAPHVMEGLLIDHDKKEISFKSTGEFRTALTFDQLADRGESLDYMLENAGIRGSE